MKHPAELALHRYMDDAVNGKSSMSDTTINKIVSDISDALKRQFGEGNTRKDFTAKSF